MIIRQHRAGRRRAAVAVETAFVMLLFTTFVFGVFEWCRFLMDWNLLNNSAREGCRYALANNTNATIATQVKTIVTKYMAGEASSFTNFTVTVSGTHSGINTSVNNLSAGDMITVTVSGTYKFMNIVPLVSMPTSFSIRSSVVMVCEGGT